MVSKREHTIDFSSSVIKGFVFSAHTDLGPELKYGFPQPPEEGEGDSTEIRNGNQLILTEHKLMQITIKNLSLLLTDEMSCSDETPKSKYFCIIPFPDFSMTALTYYRNITVNSKDQTIAFSLLVDEDNRNFLYVHHDKIQDIIRSFFEEFETQLSDGYISQEEAIPDFRQLLNKLKNLERVPVVPSITQRMLKIVFAGLDNSGKTSFLLTLDRQFSKLMNIKPTSGANIQSIQILGATIVIWDLGGQEIYTKNYLAKPEIYLFESDLIFYFIDVKDSERFEESLNYLKEIQNIIKENLKRQISMVYIFSKGDMDILETPEIQKNIQYLKTRLRTIHDTNDIEMYITSIFEFTTILRAFSAGISGLSPNRSLLEYNLKQFSQENEIYISLLLSSNGLILGDYYSNALHPLLTKQNRKREIQDAFEITAPQFAMLFKIFSKFKALNKNQAIFSLSNSFILIKGFTFSDKQAFILFLIDNMEKKEEINQVLPEFLDKIKDLLSNYIF
jgi:GTPase SAR1 family protein